MFYLHVSLDSCDTLQFILSLSSVLSFSPAPSASRVVTHCCANTLQQVCRAANISSSCSTLEGDRQVQHQIKCRKPWGSRGTTPSASSASWHFRPDLKAQTGRFKCFWPFLQKAPKRYYIFLKACAPLSASTCRLAAGEKNPSSRWF